MGPAATRDFLSRFAGCLDERIPADPLLRPFAEAVAGLQNEPDATGMPSRSSHPITGNTSPLLDRATADPALIDPIRRMVDILPWYQIFQGGGIDPVLAKGLFAAQLAGPVGFVGGGSVRVGLFLLGPNIAYPLHCHAADELYFGLSGTLTLQHGWQGKPFTIDGKSHSVTPSNRLHSLSTGSEPVLLAFIWMGELNAPNWWWAQQTETDWRRTCWVRTPTGAWTIEREEAVPRDLLAAQT